MKSSSGPPGAAAFSAPAAAIRPAGPTQPVPRTTNGAHREDGGTIAVRSVTWIASEGKSLRGRQAGRQERPAGVPKMAVTSMLSDVSEAESSSPITYALAKLDPAKSRTAFARASLQAS